MRLAAALTALLFAVLGAFPGTPAAAATAHSWIATAGAIRHLERIRPGLAGYFFNRSSSFSLGVVGGGFATTPFDYFTSFATFSQDVSTIDKRVYKYVLYDPEAWAKTPPAEQQNPEMYLQLFGQLAHQYGFKALLEPARDLARTDIFCPDVWGSFNAWYVNCHIAAYAVKYGDGLVVQTQRNETNIPRFDYLFNNAAQQAAAENPGAWVDAELSACVSPDATQAFNAGVSVSAAGYWFACAGRHISWLTAVLSEFRTAGY